MKIKIGACATILGITLTSGAVHADTNHNLQIMIDAARQLTWDDWMGNNHANLLVKQETLVTPVAVIFGYADNAVACEALAHALSQPQTRAGTFKCQPIF
tara:strand:+ start:894 stop:1193 length:300 start_codon:yes stop_codon:yes gene_type:complete